MPEIRYWSYLLDSIDVNYKFKTDVLKSLDGEQRFRNRSKPRVTYTVTSKVSDADLAAAKALLVSQLSDTEDYRGKIYIPRPDQGIPITVGGVEEFSPADFYQDFWFEADITTLYTDSIKNTNVTASGQTIGYADDIATLDAATTPLYLVFDTSKLRVHHRTSTTRFAFNAGETVVNIDPSTVSVTIEADQIVVLGTDNPLFPYINNKGNLYPYELCRIITPPEITRAGYNDNTITFTVMSLEWEANYNPAASSLTLDGNGDALVDFIPVYKAGYSDSIVLPEQIIDFTGPAFFQLTELGLDQLSNRGFHYNNLDEYNLLQDFVECVSGKFKKFYAYDDATSVSREAFRLNSDDITFSNAKVGGTGVVSIPFKKLEGANE